MSFFGRLNYSLGDEDAAVEVQALAEGASSALCVAGSGARVVPLLLKRPRAITCVDLSAEQLALTELRVEAIRALEHAEYLALLGFGPRAAAATAEGRARLLARLPLTDGARQVAGALLLGRPGAPPLIYAGRFEQMLMRLSRAIRAIAGPGLTRIFDCASLEEQRAYWRSARFPHRRWRVALWVLGNGTVLNTLLYRGEFPKKNVPGSAYQNYARIFRELFDNVYCRRSAFLQLLLLGELRYLEGSAFETDAVHFAAYKRALASTAVVYRRADVVEAMRSAPAPIDFVSLSDVPSFLGPGDDHGFLRAARPALSPGARVVFRGHLRVADPDTAGYDDVTARYGDDIRNETTQLWRIRVVQRT